MGIGNIELRLLSSFVTACDHASLGAAARKLGVSVSTLSAQLSTLETNFGFDLFRRRGRNLVPSGSAAWLYPRAQRLLLAEEFLRVRAPLDERMSERIELRLDAAWAGGQLGFNLIEAIRTFHKLPGTPFLDVVLTHNDQPLSTMPPLTAAAALSNLGTVKLICTAPGAALPEDMPLLVSDTWAVIRTGRGVTASLPKSICIPGLPETLVASLRKAPPRGLRERRLRLLDCQPQDVSNLIGEMAGTGFIMPDGMIPCRLLGDDTAQIVRFVDDDAIEIRAEVDGQNIRLKQCLEQFRAGMRISPDGPIEPSVFTPQVTMRQLRLFNLALRSGSLNSAAQIAQVAAPVVPVQIGKLEAALGRKVLMRGHAGSNATPFGNSIERFCESVRVAFDAILEARSKVAAEHGSAIRVGVPTSWGRDCQTTEQVANALSAFSAQQPDCRIEVVEGSRDFLHEGVRTGTVNFALVGRADPQFGSILVGDSEDVSLVVNRQLLFSPAGDHVSPAEIAELPLITAPEQLTMHRTFLAHFRALGIEAAPVMRLGSIPLIVAMLRRMPLCSVLPESVVRDELDLGIVQAFSLKHVIPHRRLWLIFSTDRPLTELERLLVSTIKQSFAESGRRSAAIATGDHRSFH